MIHKLSQQVRRISLMSTFVALGVMVGTATAYAASPPTLYKVCDRNGTGRFLCLKVQSANPPAKPKKDSQVLLKSGETAFQNQFHLISVGKVTASATKNWPFTAGEGLNGKLKGDRVYQIKYAPAGKETGQCLAVPNTYKKQPNTAVRVEPCSGGKTTYWAYAGKNLINVQATNQTNDKTKELLTASGSNAIVHKPYTTKASKPFQEFILGRA